MTHIQNADRELIDLAVKMRPDWDRDDFAGALLAAKHAGWEDDLIFARVADLILDPDAAPRDLRAAAASPFRAAIGRPSDDSAGWAQVARDRLEHRNDPTGEVA